MATMVEAADKIFLMLQLFVHSKSAVESKRETTKILAFVESQFNLLPASTTEAQVVFQGHTTSKKIKVVRTKESAWGWFNRVIVAYVLDKPANICLWAYTKAGINVSGGRGPNIESYNASQKFNLGTSANYSFAETIYKVPK